MRKANYRKSDLAKIHLAKKELGMDDDTYRTMLKNVAGVGSAKDLDAKGRSLVLDHLRGLGMKFKRKPSPSYPGKPSNMNDQLTKIEALLTDMGLEWNYANALSKRMFKVERVAWLKKKDQRQAIITALVKEQEKRNLSAQIDSLLDELHMSESDIDALVAKDKVNWRRNLKYLKAINNHLNGLLEESA